jgi:DHA1 family bicyclomycin/chloramphenicol resistance-like MFS transporter
MFSQIIFLAVVAAVGVISATLCAPALPYIADHFSVGYANIQFTLSLFLIGNALGQFLSGTFADRFGQKIVLRNGLFLYIAASAACAFAESMPMLLVARFFQGMGASVGPVLARSITAELFPRDRSAVVQSYGALAIGVSGMLANLTSGYLSLHSWKSNFVLAALFGVVLYIWSRPALKSLPHTPSTTAQVFSNIRKVFREPIFLQNAISHTLTYGLMYGYIGLFPFLLKEYFNQSDSMQVGIYSVAMIACYMAGAFFTARVVQHVNAERMAILGACIQGAAGAMLLFASSGTFFLFSLFVFNFSIGLILPSTTACALAPFVGTAVGTASAALGLSYRFFGALISTLITWLPLAQGKSFGLCLLGLSIASFALLMSRRLETSQRA